MTQIRKATLLFFILFTCFATAQERITVRQYLKTLEAKFPYNFSFKDSDLTDQLIVPNTSANFEEVLDFLRKNTLLEYNLLEDRTIALRKIDGLASLCGTIYNMETDAPFEGVKITTPYQESVSAMDGTFNLQLRRPDEEIRLEFIGFESLRLSGVNFQNKPCAKVTLSPKLEYLNAVNLSNYFAKGISKNEDGSLNINYQDFDILPGLIEPDVLLTIQALPGIQSVNETVSFLNIRGGTNDQNLILWDGIKMYQNGHFFGLISAFNPFLTQDVTVMKNGSPASYGDGVSGVISMEGKEAINKEFKGEIGVNLISTDAFVDVPLGEIGSVQVAGRKSLNNLLKTPTYDSYFEKAFQNTELTITNPDILPTSNDDFSFFDTSFRIQVQPTDKDFFRANFLALGNSLEFLENANINDTLQSRKSDLLQNNVSGGFYYKRLWNDRFTTDIQFYGSSYELQASNFDIINNQQLFQANDVLESGIKAKGRYEISEKLAGEIGYQFNETGITNFVRINNPFFEQRDKQVLITNSGFAEISYRPSNKTLLNLGLRMNHIDKFDEILWEPRLSFNHQFLDYFTFEILGELKSQTTSQIIDFQNDFLGIENRRWVLSSPGEIPIIQGRQLSAGLAFNRKGWLVSAEPYIKKVTGITSQSQGFQNQFQNLRTTGSYTTYGVDFLLNKRFKKINTWLSYSYADNEYEFNEFIPQSFHNNIDIRHTLTYGINYSLNNFNISGGFNWHTGKPNTPLVPSAEIIDEEINFGMPNSTNIQDYFRVDISGTYQFKMGKSTEGFVGLSIWNLLDTNNVTNQFFRINSEEEIEEIDELALGFTPNISFRLRF